MYKKGYNLNKDNILFRGYRLVKDKGLAYVLKKSLYLSFYSVYLKLFPTEKYFKYKNQNICYLYDNYNDAYANERTIEVPLIKHIAESSKIMSQEIIEVGNVLSHYYATSWTVVDKYESGTNVINEDIVSFKPGNKYKLALSISTLEHIGFDEPEVCPEKVIRAIQNIKENVLDINGKFIFTVPVGWNKNIDKLIYDEVIGIDEVYYYKRVSWLNEWVSTSKKEAFATQFGKPYYGANGIVVGYI